MNSVILSIKPKYAELIIQDSKLFEYRRKIWKGAAPGDTVYIYASTPIKEVIGEFTLGEIFFDNAQQLWDVTMGWAHGGITEDEFMRYMGDTPGYALSIIDVIQYKNPLSLHTFGFKTPPQNFYYFKRG